MNIELARPDDLPELLDFLYAAFRAGNPDHPRFEALFPDLVAPTAEAMARHQIIRKGGRIVSCVGTYPMTVRIAGCRVPAAGLGQVSTAPDMQGHGFMTQLLAAAGRRMEEEGAAVSWLGGRHDRYGRHGVASLPQIPSSEMMRQRPPRPDQAAPSPSDLRSAKGMLLHRNQCRKDWSFRCLRRVSKGAHVDASAIGRRLVGKV